MVELTISIDESFGKLEKAERKRILAQLVAISEYKQVRYVGSIVGVDNVELVWN